MRFFCTQLNLEEALNIVNKAITLNTTLPILNNILLKTDSNKLYLFSTNLEIAIQYFIFADIRSEGAITIPAKLITNYISLLKNENIEVSLMEGNIVSLNSPFSQTKIKGINADEFPTIPKIQHKDSFKVSVKDLDLAIIQTVFSAAINTSTPALSGVLFKVDNNNLTIAATDSYRLAEKKIYLKDKTDISLSVIIPARTITELGKILSRFHVKNSDVDISISKNQVLFKIENIEFTSRLIEGKFPNYERIIPKSTKTKISVSTDEFALVVKRVSLFARENGDNIKVSATNNGRLLVSTDETKVGEENAEISAVVDGENNKISLNAKYLLDVLTFIQSDRVIFEIDDKLSPAIIRPDKDSKDKNDYVYIIMPLKT